MSMSSALASSTTSTLARPSAFRPTLVASKDTVSTTSDRASQPRDTVETSNAKDGPVRSGFDQMLGAMESAFEKPDPKTQSVSNAEQHHKLASEAWDKLMDSSSQLTPEQKQEAGKNIFYTLASSSQEYKNPDGTPMNTDQSRKVFSEYDKTAKEAADARVMDYGQKNPEMMNMAVASGYADWAAQSVNKWDDRQKAGDQVSLEEATRTQDVFNSGNDYVTNRGGYISDLNDLWKMGEKDTVNGLMQRLDGGGVTSSASN